MRPFRFGVVVLGDAPIADWCEFARRVESLGYSSLLLGDHMVDYLPLEGASPIVALTAAAAATSTVRVGTMMLANDFRHPAVLAKDAATLDVISNGRLELGLGAGWLASDYEAIGLPFDEPGVRIERLAESIEVIRSAWRGEPFDLTGNHYTIQGYAARPRPLQQPHPPIMIGGGKPRILRLAGQQADIVGIHVATTASDFAVDTEDAQTRRKLAWVKEGAGDRFPEIELQMSCTVGIARSARTAAQPIARRLGIPVEHLLCSAMMLFGTVEELCGRLEQRREEWGISYVVIPSETYEPFARVVECLSGT
jgi:probable F420-dependent oxidoreductase